MIAITFGYKNLQSYYKRTLSIDTEHRLTVCLVNHWPGASITNEHSILTEIFTSLGYEPIEAPNDKNCRIAIDSVFGNEKNR